MNRVIIREREKEKKREKERKKEKLLVSLILEKDTKPLSELQWSGSW